MKLAFGVASWACKPGPVRPRMCEDVQTANHVGSRRGPVGLTHAGVGPLQTGELGGRGTAFYLQKFAL